MVLAFAVKLSDICQNVIRQLRTGLHLSDVFDVRILLDYLQNRAKSIKENGAEYSGDSANGAASVVVEAHAARYNEQSRHTVN